MGFQLLGRSTSRVFAFIYALLLVSLAESRSTNGLNRSEDASELRVALPDYGLIGDHGWTYDGHVGAFKMARVLPYVILSERECVSDQNASQILREFIKQDILRESSQVK